MCYHAVVYNIMIIGEAANMLTKELFLLYRKGEVGVGIGFVP